MNKKDTYSTIVDYVVMIFFVITSASIFYVHILSPAITYFFLLLLGIANKWRISVDNGYPALQFNTSWWFVIFIAVLAIVSQLYYNHTYEDRNLLGYLVILTAAYFIISSYDFDYFRRLLTNVVFVIVLLGLPVFFLNELELLPTAKVVLPAGKTYVMFGIYTLGWPWIFHRFSGIWHEPGACQIILNTVLWLHFEHFKKWNWRKGELFKMVVIMLGALATLSTGSYLQLMLLLVSVLPNLNVKVKHPALVKTIAALFVCVAVFTIFTSDIVQKKLFAEESIENVSKVERTADALALFQMTIDRPILGYGLGTHEFWTVSKRLGNTANSTGLLTFTASFGVMWLMAFVIVVFVRIRQLGYGAESVLILLAVLIMQSNEDYIEYPITSIFVFSFGSYASDVKTKRLLIILMLKNKQTLWGRYKKVL